LPIFYTLPPWRIKYPYILINNRNPEQGLKYLINYGHWRHTKKIIIDTGIEIFRDKEIKDYPGGYKHHTRRQVLLYEKIRKIARYAEVYVTIPDYPDDYHPKNLWISREYTNIERTIDSVFYAITNYPNINWLIPVQGWNHRPKSVIHSLQLLYRRDFPFERYNYYAIANLCVEQKCDIIVRTVEYAYNWFKDVLGYIPRIHLFGPKLRCVRKIVDKIYSWDSMAWTRPVEHGLHKKYPWSAKNEEQRELFFMKYLEHIYKSVIGNDYGYT